jgi:hypothetical protein
MCLIGLYLGLLGLGLFPLGTSHLGDSKCKKVVEFFANKSRIQSSALDRYESL